MIDVLLGLQWGDEGKGKIVDYLANQYQVVARFQGGPNAGHTLILDGKKYVLHTIPSGIFRDNVLNLIGNGVVIDPITLQKELAMLAESGLTFKDRLFVAQKAHLILPTHRLLDAVQEAAKGKSKIGSTLRGIGPTYTDKIGRQGLRVGDILAPDFKKRYDALKWLHIQQASQYPKVEFNLKEEEEKWLASVEELRQLNLVDGEYFIDDCLKKGQRILAEGAQGSMLDIDFGTYPFVTSSNTITAGVCNGLGVAPQRIGEVIGITKAYCTRVGGGPFPTELDNDLGEQIRQAGGEFGATTGRPRRCGWIDLPQLKYTVMLNGVTQLVMTKVDILNDFEQLTAATHYDCNGKITDRVPFDINQDNLKPVWKNYTGWSQDLDQVKEFDQFPQALKDYVQDMENILGVPFSIISTGPGREQLVLCQKTVSADNQ
ncbi:MAG: adenylosuccinate synthase [Saprospiraceae bacterium]|nr:adenylosuccinate synthase [Saprospiraceae bacterium]